jgi:hypothetical protein
MTIKHAAEDKGLVRFIHCLQNIPLAFIAWVESLGKRFRKTHFFPIPSLAAPAFTF